MNTYVTIARQRGLFARSVGHVLAEKLNVAYHDNVTMAEFADPSVRDYFKSSGELRNADPHFGTYNFALTHYATVNDAMNEAQTEVINTLADQGPAVFVGRCADHILKNRTEDTVVSVFLFASEEYRVQQVMDRYGFTQTAAKKHIKTIDKSRATYYEYYTEKKWGARDSYDLLINAEGLDAEAISSIIAAFVEGKNK